MGGENFESFEDMFLGCEMGETKGQNEGRNLEVRVGQSQREGNNEREVHQSGAPMDSIPETEPFTVSQPIDFLKRCL